MKPLTIDILLIAGAAVLAALAVKALVAVFKDLFLIITVYEYQRGLHYNRGKLQRLLEPGEYILLRMFNSVVIVDLRNNTLNVVNQEVVCADNLALRFSIGAVYKVADPVKVTHECTNYATDLYLLAQIVLREATAGLKVEEVLAKRNEVSKNFYEMFKLRASDLGVEVTSGGIKDITFPGDVKKIFSQVAQAEKASQAALAKSRAEVASLRALGNASRMIESNPHLLTLRTLQSVSELATTSGNTIVLGLPPGLMPLPISGKNAPTQPIVPDNADDDESD